MNNISIFSAGMPIPVSLTSNANSISPVALSFLNCTTPTRISPSCVNLTALLTRLISTCRNRKRIPDDHRRHSLLDPARQPQPGLSRLFIEKVQHPVDTSAQIEILLLDLHLPRIDLGKVKDIIQHTQQAFPAAEDRFIVVPLLLRQLGLRQQAAIPITPFIGVRIS